MERVVPPSILKDRHHPPIWKSLDPLGCHVAVSSSVTHDDEKLVGFGFDGMLSPI